MQTAFFCKTQQIPDSSSIFDHLKEQNIFFSYFRVNRNYYLFLYAQRPIQLDDIYESVEIIEELEFKQRKIRSFRGFFLYALEIMETEKDSNILNTNLQPFFWRKVKNVIRQNKKGALPEFLFGEAKANQDKNLEDQIRTLQDQINFLQQKIIKLEENQTLEIKKALSELLKRSQLSKTIQQGEVPSKEDKGLNQQNFITLGKISEEDKIEIIQTGFRLNQEGRISLKKYYESTEPNSLLQWKKYSIKYESIRQTKLYKELKLENN